jgi:hypothetical protein
MGYELWDIESRSLLYDFDTLDEVIEAALELTEPNPGRYPEGLAMAHSDADQNFTWLAHGPAMTRMLEQHPAPKAIGKPDQVVPSA